MSSFIALRKTIDLSADNNHHLLVGRQQRDIPDTSNGKNGVVTTIKRHYDFTTTVQFNSDGGSKVDPQEFVLGSTYRNLPTPTKTQCIFLGWKSASNQYVKEGDPVELSNVSLTAQWEYVNIDTNCTEFVISTNSSYRKAGIYSASRYSSTSAVYVDWGDGAVEKISGDISQLTHEYKSNGVFHAKVSNNITNFAASYSNSTWYGTTTNNRYVFKDVVKTGSRCTSMPSYAFYYCALSSINFLSSCWTNITSLPSYAFTYCQQLTQLSNLPSRIKTLGSNCFQYCTGLTGIQDLRNTGLTSLYNSYTFSNCSNVKEWKFPATLGGTYFGTNQFYSNTNLSAIELPSTLTSIPSYGFYSNTQLKKINIPSKVASINSYAFYGCSTLSSITYQTSGLTSIQSYAFYNCYGLRNLNLPQSVKTIGERAFYGCYSSYASALTLPSSLTSLNAYAFYNCYNLKNLSIPSSLATIGDYAFAGCYRLSSIVDTRLTAQSVSTNTFGNTASNSSNGYTGYNSRGNNILCTYVFADGFDDGIWSDPLQNSSKCGFTQQYIDPENIKYCTITFDAGTGTTSTPTAEYVQGKKIKNLPSAIGPADSPYFGGWWTGENGTGTRYSNNTIVPSQSSLTLYAFYSATPLYSYTVDLNGQWRQSTSQTNPDPSLYDGVFESNSNYNVHSGYAKMYVRIEGYDEFTLYIRSYAESSYDYTIAFNPDVNVTSNPSSSSSGVKAHTSGKQVSGQAIGNYTEVKYTNLGGGSHFICIVYRKDGSVNSGNDRGYLLIPKEQ